MFLTITISVRYNGLDSFRGLLDDLLSTLLNLFCNLARSWGLFGQFLHFWHFGIGTGDAGIYLVLAVLLDEDDQVFDGTGSTVVNRAVLAASWVELDGWEPLDLFWNVIGSRIHFGDGHFLIKVLVGGV